MSKFINWMRNEPIDPRRVTRVSRSIGAIDTPRSNRPRGDDDVTANERDFSVTCNLGGFTGVGIPWSGTSHEDARDSFLEFLYNHDEFGLDADEPFKFYRSLYVNFKGSHQLLVFRTTWITGFTVG